MFLNIFNRGSNPPPPRPDFIRIPPHYLATIAVNVFAMQNKYPVPYDLRDAWLHLSHMVALTPLTANQEEKSSIHLLADAIKSVAFNIPAEPVPNDGKAENDEPFELPEVISIHESHWNILKQAAPVLRICADAYCDAADQTADTMQQFFTLKSVEALQIRANQRLRIFSAALTQGLADFEKDNNTAYISPPYRRNL